MRGKMRNVRKIEDELTFAEAVAILVTLVLLGVLGFGVVAV